MEKLLHHPCNTLRAKSFEVMMRQRIRKIIDEIKPEAVDVTGVEDMLRHLIVYINVNDYERIKCLLTNNGRIAAWDELFDVLKTCDEKAFEKYVSLILSHRSKAPGEVKEKVKEVCRRNGLEMLCREQSDCGKSHKLVLFQIIPTEVSCFYFNYLMQHPVVKLSLSRTPI